MVNKVLCLEDIFSDVAPQKLDVFGQNMAEGWGMGTEWPYKTFGEIAPEATEKGKYQPFLHDAYHAPVRSRPLHRLWIFRRRKVAGGYIH